MNTVTPSVLCDPAAPESGGPVPVATIPISSAMILVVDDDAGLCMLVERYLTMFGYRALLASDGEAALRIARSALTAYGCPTDSSMGTSVTESE